MNLEPLRSLAFRPLLALFALVSSLILGSCGGGGAASTPLAAGDTPQLLPAAATLYAGVPYTFTIAGGRKPYLLSSSEPVLLPLPAQVDGNTFQVVGNNPGVVDANLPPGSLPIRTVIITIRDSAGATFATATTNGISVAQNFMTGYGIAFTSTCPLPTGATTPPPACAGNESFLNVTPVSNGGLYGNRPFKFQVVRGDFAFVDNEVPSNQPGHLVNSITLVTDHDGKVAVRFFVPLTAPTQLATVRITDVGTGAYTDEIFTIQQLVVTGDLTILPATITFTGSLANRCGTGTAEFFVFGGTPPFTAISSSPLIGVAATDGGTTSEENPGRFTVTAVNQQQCEPGATITVVDAFGRHGTMTVITALGTIPVPPLTVSPATVNLSLICGQSASVTVVGGNGGFSASSSHPRVSATASGNTVTITRLGGDNPALAPFPNTATVSITDGSTIVPVSVTGVAPGPCP